MRLHSHPARQAALEGLDLDVLGVRSVGDGTVFHHAVVYADASLVPGGNLSAAADTRARLVDVRVPPTEAFSVLYPGGPRLPEVELELGGEGKGN